MFIEERQIAIEKVLREEGKVRTRELSEMFQVTEDCIRKDLKTLENAGKLKRTYGGAILSQDYPLERDVIDRRNYHVEKKMVIAAKAMKLIREFICDDSVQFIKLCKFIRFIKIKFLPLHHGIFMTAAFNCSLLGQSVLHSKSRDGVIHHINSAASHKCPVKAVLPDHLDCCRTKESIYCRIHDSTGSNGCDLGILRKQL